MRRLLAQPPPYTPAKRIATNYPPVTPTLHRTSPWRPRLWHIVEARALLLGRRRRRRRAPLRRRGELLVVLERVKGGLGSRPGPRRRLLPEGRWGGRRLVVRVVEGLVEGAVLVGGLVDEGGRGDGDALAGGLEAVLGGAVLDHAHLPDVVHVAVFALHLAGGQLGFYFEGTVRALVAVRVGAVFVVPKERVSMVIWDLMMMIRQFRQK